MIPRPAVEHYRRMQRLQAGASLAARRAWRSVDPQWISESWAEAVPDLSDAVAVRQVKAAAMGAGYGADTLAAQAAYVAPVAFVNTRAFAGQSSLGLPLGNVIYSPAIKVKEWISQGYSPASAMRMGGKLAESIAQTQVADAGRSAASVDTFTRPTVMYTRMLNPPSCSRCSVLAGRVYRNNQGFMRHPRCDCVHVVTASEAAAKAEGLIHDPYEYFESLSEAEQDRLYTKAGAQAIRELRPVPGGELPSRHVLCRGLQRWHPPWAARLDDHPRGHYQARLLRRHYRRLREAGRTLHADPRPATHPGCHLCPEPVT